MEKVKIVNPNNDWLGTKCYIDGNKVKNVKSVDFRVAVDELPHFTFETLGLPDIDVFGDVQFSFTPETVQQAATILRNEFIENIDSRKALVTSIDSVLQEESGEYLLHDLSEKIANRIIGLEGD